LDSTDSGESMEERRNEADSDGGQHSEHGGTRRTLTVDSTLSTEERSAGNALTVDSTDSVGEHGGTEEQSGH